MFFAVMLFAASCHLPCNPRFHTSELLSLAEFAEIFWPDFSGCPLFFAYPDNLLLNPAVLTAVVLHLRSNPVLMSSEVISLYRNPSSVVWNIFWYPSRLKAHIVSMSIIKKKKCVE